MIPVDYDPLNLSGHFLYVFVPVCVANSPQPKYFNNYPLYHPTYNLHQTHILLLLLRYSSRTSTAHITYTYTLSFLVLFTYSSYTIHQARYEYSLLFFFVMSNRQRRRRRKKEECCFKLRQRMGKITAVMRDDCCFLISIEREKKNLEYSTHALVNNLPYVVSNN